MTGAPEVYVYTYPGGQKVVRINDGVGNVIDITKAGALYTAVLIVDEAEKIEGATFDPCFVESE